MNNAEILRNFIIEEILTDSSRINIGNDDSLLDTGVIDSFGIVKILSFLSYKFNLDIEDRDVIPENFETINAITSFVEKKQMINMRWIFNI